MKRGSFMNVNQKWYHQTFVIVAAFIIFWPVGIYFLVSRNNATKQGMFVGGLNFKQSIIIAIILLAIALFCLFDKETRAASIIYIIGAIAIAYYGKNNEQKIARYRKYVELINNNNISSIDTIASACGTNYDTCRAELATLISKGVFKNATINDTNHTINFIKKAVPTNGQVVMITCSGCGASITIAKGTSCECDYCGNILRG